VIAAHGTVRKGSRVPAGCRVSSRSMFDHGIASTEATSRAGVSSAVRIRQHIRGAGAGAVGARGRTVRVSFTPHHAPAHARSSPRPQSAGHLAAHGGSRDVYRSFYAGRAFGPRARRGRRRRRARWPLELLRRDVVADAAPACRVRLPIDNLDKGGSANGVQNSTSFLAGTSGPVSRRPVYP